MPEPPPSIPVGWSAAGDGVQPGGRPPAPASAARPGGPSDLPEVHRLWAVTFPQLPVPDVSGALAEGRALVLSRASRAGRLAGAALVGAVADAPDQRRLTVLADGPDAWAAVEACAARLLRSQGVERWHVVVREDAATSVDRLRAAGYELSGTSWGAELAAEDVDVAALAALVAAVAAAGVSLRPLGPGDAQAAQRLVLACRADFPSTPATPAPDPTVQEVLRALGSAEHAAFGAFVDGGRRLVGLTALDLAPAGPGGPVADTDLTAVASDHRGRGVASAVKACAVLALLDRGVVLFRTGGAAVNEASTRANRRLGYAVEPVWMTWTGR